MKCGILDFPCSNPQIIKLNQTHNQKNKKVERFPVEEKGFSKTERGREENGGMCENDEKSAQKCMKIEECKKRT